MNPIDFTNKPFNTFVEVVPADGFEATPLIQKLKSISDLKFDAFSVATNPVAKPRMSALVTCALAQQATHVPAILHCTTRDHNRIGLQSLLWGAKASGINTILAATGDMVAFEERHRTTTVRDMDVFGLVEMARQSGIQTGVVVDPRPESNGFETAIRRLERKVAAGAQFAVTQPIYDAASSKIMAEATQSMGIPIIMGILPLRTARHADFLHHKVAGIAVPKPLRDLMKQSDTTEGMVKTGNQNAREMLAVARKYFAGACIMPPFDHYEVLEDILT